LDFRFIQIQTSHPYAGHTGKERDIEHPLRVIIGQLQLLGMPVNWLSRLAIVQEFF
jgi:hypothetical protein